MAYLKNLILFFLLAPVTGQAAELKYIGNTVLSFKMKFKSTVIGGLSGLYYSSSEKYLYAVSDDRGRVNEPRFYQFKVELSGSTVKIEPHDVFFVRERGSGRRLKGVLDLEAIAPLPWGNFLLSSEGDNNRKPRDLPRLLDVKPNGEWIRDFALPTQMLPELTGKQKVGIQNNRGVEGLSTSPSGKKIMAAVEDPLVQDVRPGEKWTRLIQYEMPEAWVIRPTKQFVYALDQELIKGLPAVDQGVSEILFLDEDRLLVMERAYRLSLSEVLYDVKIFLVELNGATEVQSLSSLAGAKLVPLKKTLLLDLKSLPLFQKGPDKIENFEGMTWGPEISGKSRTLILVSDDNFMRNHRTQFLVLEYQP